MKTNRSYNNSALILAFTTILPQTPNFHKPLKILNLKKVIWSEFEAHFGQFEHLLTHRSSPLNWENLTAKILFAISRSTSRVCSIIKKSIFKNQKKEPLTIILPSATILIDKFECSRRREHRWQCTTNYSYELLACPSGTPWGRWVAFSKISPTPLISHH